MRNYGHWSSTDLTVWLSYGGRKVSVSLSLSFSLVEKSSKSNNSIDGREGKSKRKREREREREGRQSALFESNWVNVKQYNARVIMDSGVNLVPYAASTNIGWDKRRPFGFLYGAKARRCNATTNSPDRLQCFPREVVRKFVISPGDFHDSSTRLSAAAPSNA